MQYALENLDKLPKIKSNFFMWYKNKDLNYVEYNKKIAEIFSFKSKLAVQGITDHDILCKAFELAFIFQGQDKFVMAKGTSQEFLTVAQSANEERAVAFVTKTPLFDDKRNIVGTFGYGLDLSKTTTHLIQLVKKSTFGHSFHQKFKSDVYLTLRESGCIFFLARGKTTKQTAQFLTLSPRTAEQYAEQLRDKFNCKIKSEVISVLIEKRFIEYISKRFLLNPRSLVFNE
jgi:DNA-binding CsgD family transcriptional regulator